MKILYINALYTPLVMGGAEISLKVLVEGMQQAGHEVVVLSLKPEGALESEQVDGVKVYRAPLQNLYWPFTKIKPGKVKRMRWHVKDQANTAMREAVRTVLSTEKPDLVSCHNLVGWSVAIWEEIHQHQIPIVQVLHDLYLLCANSDMFKNNASCTRQCLSCALLRRRHPAQSKAVNAVVGISKFILHRFQSFHYFPNAQQRVIYNSRNIPETPLPLPREKGRPLRVGYLGTLAAKKGLEWLIDQFLKLDVPASLLIAGKGELTYENKIKALAYDPNISFIGYTEANAFYKTIDVLVIPSLWEEPLGMVVIEALAHHIPVIINQVGGLKETVKHGYNGLWCDHHHPDSLGEAIKKLAKDHDLYERFVQQARPSVASILNKENMINAYQALYNTLTKNHEGTAD